MFTIQLALHCSKLKSCMHWLFPGALSLLTETNLEVFYAEHNSFKAVNV